MPALESLRLNEFSAVTSCIFSSRKRMFLERGMGHYTEQPTEGREAFRRGSGSSSAPSRKRKPCLHAFRLGTLAWFMAEASLWTLCLPLVDLYTRLECPQYDAERRNFHLQGM
jgi:hypothetical protein